MLLEEVRRQASFWKQGTSPWHQQGSKESKRKIRKKQLEKGSDSATADTDLSTPGGGNAGFLILKKKMTRRCSRHSGHQGSNQRLHHKTPVRRGHRDIFHQQCSHPLIDARINDASRRWEVLDEEKCNSAFQSVVRRKSVKAAKQSLETEVCQPFATRDRETSGTTHLLHQLGRRKQRDQILPRPTVTSTLGKGGPKAAIGKTPPTSPRPQPQTEKADPPARQTISIMGTRSSIFGHLWTTGNGRPT